MNNAPEPSQLPTRVERLSVLDGGNAVAPDRSEYSPGVDKGNAVALSCHAYRHDPGLLR